MNYRYVSALWHRLMTELEYEGYGSGGGDFGGKQEVEEKLAQAQFPLSKHSNTDAA